MTQQTYCIVCRSSSQDVEGLVWCGRPFTEAVLSGIYTSLWDVLLYTPGGAPMPTCTACLEAARGPLLATMGAMGVLPPPCPECHGWGFMVSMARSGDDGPVPPSRISMVLCSRGCPRARWTP